VSLSSKRVDVRRNRRHNTHGAIAAPLTRMQLYPVLISRVGILSVCMSTPILSGKDRRHRPLWICLNTETDPPKAKAEARAKARAKAESMALNVAVCFVLEGVAVGTVSDESVQRPSCVPKQIDRRQVERRRVARRRVSHLSAIPFRRTGSFER
jgi:hypothetical protein